MPKKLGEKNLARRIGNRIKSLRLKKRLSQFDLAEKAGIGISYISKIEQGSRLPSLKTSVRLAKALNVELFEIFNFRSRLLDKENPSKEYLELASLIDHLSNDEVTLFLGLARKLNRNLPG